MIAFSEIHWSRGPIRSRVSPNRSSSHLHFHYSTFWVDHSMRLGHWDHANSGVHSMNFIEPIQWATNPIGFTIVKLVIPSYYEVHSYLRTTQKRLMDNCGCHSLASLMKNFKSNALWRVLGDPPEQQDWMNCKTELQIRLNEKLIVNSIGFHWFRRLNTVDRIQYSFHLSDLIEKMF